MSKPRIQRIGNKWVKAKILMNHPELGKHHPETRLLNKDSLYFMLAKHKMVYIKPVYGCHGNGVIRLDMPAAKTYRYQSGSRKKTFSNFPVFYDAIKKRIKSKPYLVQEGIRLLKYQQRHFDVRVMVQKNPHNRWEVSGMLCRAAHPHSVVTNLVKGGIVVSVDRALSPHASREKRKQLVDKIKKIGMKTANHLESKYPRIKELGLDVAVDLNLKPWILEVNMMPNLWLFLKLSDKSMFYRIIRNAKAYGRIKS